MVTKRIIFSGEFNLGERLNESLVASVEEARAFNDNLATTQAVFVGDLGFTEKILSFHQGGLEAVAEDYMERRLECDSACQVAQMPSDYNEAIEKLDEGSLSFALERLEAEGVDLEDKSTVNSFLRDNVIPTLVQRRLRVYGLRDPQLFSERRLRNRVTERTKKSWRNSRFFKKDARAVYLNEERVINSYGLPICRGIMLALLEELTETGFNEILFFDPNSSMQANRLGIALFRRVYLTLPRLRGKELPNISAKYF